MPTAKLLDGKTRLGLTQEANDPSSVKRFFMSNFLNDGIGLQSYVLLKQGETSHGVRTATTERRLGLLWNVLYSNLA